MTRRFAPEPENLDGRGGGNLLVELRGGGGGGDAPVEAPAPRPLRRKVSPQTLILILVLVASVASIYTMRKQGMGAGIKFKPVSIDYQPEKPRAEDLRNRQRVMAELARSAAGATAGDHPLLKNPFRMALLAQGDGGAGPDAHVVRREDEVRAALAQLTVTSIMQGTVPLARISGKTVRVSDTVEGTFMVTEIGDRSVSLMVEGKIYTLPLADGQSGARRTMPNPPRR